MRCPKQPILSTVWCSSASLGFLSGATISAAGKSQRASGTSELTLCSVDRGLGICRFLRHVVVRRSTSGRQGGRNRRPLVAVGPPIFRSEIQVRPDRLERPRESECGTVEDASTDTSTRFRIDRVGQERGRMPQGSSTGASRPVPAQGSRDARIAPLSPEDSRSGARHDLGCVSSCEHSVHAPRQPALSCGPVAGSARSPPHGRRLATGFRCPAEAGAATAGIRPCGPATPPRCGCREAGSGPAPAAAATATCAPASRSPRARPASAPPPPGCPVRRAHGAPAKTAGDPGSAAPCGQVRADHEDRPNRGMAGACLKRGALPGGIAADSVAAHGARMRAAIQRLN